ncbi:hypothetical protein HQ560_06780, partial [bacterium]|nr:hypothetical protein [bacterium]
MQTWKNNGGLRGAFHALNTPPVVEQVAGRKAVTFAYGPWALPMEFQPMVADFNVPDGIIGGADFTVAAWLYNPGGVDFRETVLAWQAITGDDGAQIGYGSEGRYPHEKGANGGAIDGPLGGVGFPDAAFPSSNAWHHIAYVCTGGRDGEFRVYVDGALAARKSFDRILRKLPATDIAETSATVKADLFLRDGKPVQVWAYVGERDNHHWRWLRWQHKLDLGPKEAGEIAVPVGDLKPGTRYHVRFLLIADDEQRWSDGAATFVTAGGDAGPEPSKEKFFFLGADWGSRWDWAVKPLRFYRGSVAGLQVYDSALSEERVRALYGKPVPKPVERVAAGASKPAPADGTRNASIYTSDLTWMPRNDRAPQNVYFGTDREAVRTGRSVGALKLGPKVKTWRIPFGTVQHCAAYYWRVEQAPHAGDVWSFTVEDYFTLEPDGPTVEPFPRDIPQDGYYGKYLAGDGYPTLSTADCPDKAMVLARRSCLKLLEKRPDVHKMLVAYNCATHLSHGSDPWGWSPFACASYGASKNMLSDPTFYWGQNMLIHEMGHQFHMFGGEPLEPDFRHRLHQVYLTNMRDLKWIGDYGSNNMWEYIAVCASAWVNDGHQDDLIYPRDRLRKNDPLFYHFLNAWWPGDTRIDLHAGEGVTESGGRVTSWANRGGVEYWGKFGWKKYRGTVGAFEAKGAPKLKTVEGVTAVTLEAGDSLVWNRATRPEMAGNHEWSVEMWMLKRSGGSPLAAWGPCGAWRAETASDVWRHVVHVFAGGGLADGPGECRVYVDGRLTSTTRKKLDLPAGVPVRIGGGFVGSIAHVRVYDYDLSPLQVHKRYRDESPFYHRDNLAVGGRLRVDLDARRLAPCPAGDTIPVHGWLRSWANHGALGGKLHNDVRTPQGSDPQIRRVDGVDAVVFAGNDRMVSSVPCDAGDAWTVELWARRNGGRGVALQWGGLTVKADALAERTWQHVAVVQDGAGTRILVDGVPKGTLEDVAGGGCLHLGAAWDGKGWSDFFDGAIAQVRIHAGSLPARQVQRNLLVSSLLHPRHPSPADGTCIVASRPNALSWTPGVGMAEGKHDLFLGTGRQAVADAVRGSDLHVGNAAPGEFAPRLKPGATYYWRVDRLGPRGKLTWRSPVWTFTTHKGVVIDLDAKALPLGALTRWPNAGVAGGAFVKPKLEGMTNPVVRTVAGRKGVDFTGPRHLASSFLAPKTITGDHAFTLAVWAYSPRVGDAETMVSWAGRPSRSAQFLYGHSRGIGAWVSYATGDCGYEAGTPPAGKWHHIVWTYAGGPKGAFRIHVDGRLKTEKTYGLRTKHGDPIWLGAVMENSSPVMPYGGLLGEVAIYDRALTPDEIKAEKLPDGALVR